MNERKIFIGTETYCHTHKSSELLMREVEKLAAHLVIGNIYTINNTPNMEGEDGKWVPVSSGMRLMCFKSYIPTSVRGMV